MLSLNLRSGALIPLERGKLLILAVTVVKKLSKALTITYKKHTDKCFFTLRYLTSAGVIHFEGELKTQLLMQVVAESLKPPEASHSLKINNLISISFDSISMLNLPFNY